MSLGINPEILQQAREVVALMRAEKVTRREFKIFDGQSTLVVDTIGQQMIAIGSFEEAHTRYFIGIPIK